jgi:hypothetical protein
MSGESLDSVSPAYRYFYTTSGLGRRTGIFRCPANGKTLLDQTMSDVERLTEDESWRPNQREFLRREMDRGHFDETDNELTLEQMRSIMAEFKRNS